MAATLLLADDSVTIQRVIELTFADEDVTVIAVSDGDAAIARVDADPPDIVLADVGMPGKTGYEVASYIKHSPRLSHIPVLLLTGAFEPVDERKASEAGCDGVLAKPFEPQLVISRVKELLGRRGAASASFPMPSPASKWAPPDPPDATEGTKTEAIGDFFDQLDAAFAKLPGARADMPEPDAGQSLGDADDVLEPDFLLSLASADSDVDRVPTSAPAMLEAPRQPPPAPPARPTDAMPALAEAFAALLAAEQPGAAPADTSAWPAYPAPAAILPAPAAITDDLVERVTQRVLERLSDRVVRETATELVSGIAERIVREEIDRIKAAIK